jgi:hypothetical protein
MRLVEMPPVRLLPLTIGCVALLACTACSSNDIVELTAMRGTDSATLVLNGRRVQCMPYEVVHGSPKVLVDNFLQARGCASEVAVFAKRNAMSLVDTGDKWSDPPGDVVSVPMRDPYVVTLNVFVMSGDLISHSAAIRQSEAIADVTTASQLFDDNQCGITFSIQVIAAETRGNFTSDLLTATCEGNLARFKAVDAERTAQSGLNVFYFDGVYGTQGQACVDGTSALILISKWSGSETLAHELGHALSLGHTNEIHEMPLDDLMMSPSSYPATLTTGQCFRTNVDTGSVLNTLQVRNEPSRSCTDSNCPPLPIQK